MNAADEILAPRIATGRDRAPALIADGRTLSYADLDALTARYGHGLRSGGVGRGDRVLLLLNDSADFVAAWLAAVRIGAVAVPLNTRMDAAQLRLPIEDSRCAALLVEDEYLPQYRQIAPELTHRPALLAVRGAAPAGERSLDDLVADQPTVLASEAMDPDDMAYWLYTSGTTGTPKAAVHRHGEVEIADRYLCEALGVRQGDRLFSSSKLFFAFALGHCLIGGLRAGATVILHPGWPDAAAIAEVVARHRPHVVFSVPTFYRNLLRDGVAETEPFRNVRRYVSAGEKLPEALYHRWREATGVGILEGIGATETLLLMVAGTPEAHRPGATGRPLPWVEARLLDDDERPVTEPGRPGVLWARMATVAKGYWNQPEKTAAAFRDGWFRTGDQFSVDPDGWWTHHGRADDMLKISGQWVSPAEIEEAAQAIPGVADAACVGTTNDDGLTRLALFVAAADAGAEAALEETLRDGLEARLPRFKLPRSVHFVAEIPRTATGKVQRFRLREMLAPASA